MNRGSEFVMAISRARRLNEAVDLSLSQPGSGSLMRSMLAGRPKPSCSSLLATSRLNLSCRDRSLGSAI